MNESAIRELLQNIDGDLLEKELGNLMKDIEIDMSSISEKAHRKLEKQMAKRKRKRWITSVAVAAVAVIGISTAYATDLPNYIKSFFNKTELYSTVIDGKGYFLEEPVPLGSANSLDAVIFTSDSLQMNLTYTLTNDEVPDVEGRTKDGRVYKPGGYGTNGDGDLTLVFFNETDENYTFYPVQEMELIIDGVMYYVTLTESTPVIDGSEVIYAVRAASEAWTPVEQSVETEAAPEQDANVTRPGAQTTTTNLDWISIGCKKEENGIMIITSFTDEDLRLTAIGEPYTKDTERTYKNDGDSTITSVTSSMTMPLVGYDKDRNEYIYNKDDRAAGRPTTRFISDVPEGVGISLSIPSLIVSYDFRKDFPGFELDIPELSQKTEMDLEIDLGLQKMLLQSIERTSETTAELIFTLNTGDIDEVSIRDTGTDSRNSISSKSVCNGDLCKMEITFQSDLEVVDFGIVSPQFVINGDWVLELN